MNENKITFISCVNDENEYEECLKFIDNLIVPEGYEIEKIGIKGAKSITSGYNQAMKKNDAKYKIYLHQDTLIINRYILFDILEIFKNKDIGMIGAAGSERISTEGRWFEGKNANASVYHNVNFGIITPGDRSSEEELIEAQAIDGLIMITQYDIDWREDIFDGWHLYDVSQTLEFIRAGYKVKVLNKKEPWIIHDCGTIWVNKDKEYNKYIEKLLNEYYENIQPKVTIIVYIGDRFNIEYFEETIDMLIKQEYKNIQIIVVDLEEKVKNSIYKYKKYLNYFNCENYIDNILGDVIGVIKENCMYTSDRLKKMLNYFVINSNTNMVTSYYSYIDRNNNKVATRKNIRYSIEPTCISLAECCKCELLTFLISKKDINVTRIKDAEKIEDILINKNLINKVIYLPNDFITCRIYY